MRKQYGIKIYPQAGQNPLTTNQFFIKGQLMKWLMG